jgi:LEA14-like dessication related protein
VTVWVDGQKVTVPSGSTKTVHVPADASVGEHERILRLRIGNEEQVWRIPYAIPEPIKLVSPTVVANERGEATLTVIVNLSEKLRVKSALKVEAAGSQFSVPLREERTTALLSVSQPLLAVKISLADDSTKPLSATVFVP